MITTFKIHKIVKNTTYVIEYWDEIPVTEYEVLFPYKEGDVKKFIVDNNCIIRRPLYSGIREFLRKENSYENKFNLK